MSVQFVVDDHGNRVAVLLDIETYQRLIEVIEDREDREAVQAYEAAKAAGDPEAQTIPLEQVIAEYEARHAETPPSVS